MKVTIEKVLRAIFRIVYNVFPPKLFSLISIVFNQLYSLYKLNEFKKIGSNFYLQYPLYLDGGKNITIGDSFSCGQRFRIDTFDEFLGDKFMPEIIIGDNVSIQKDCHIGAINKIVIGNNVLVASKVYLSDHSHGEITKEVLDLPPAKRRLFSKGPVVIEDNVWLGESVVVLPNVTIGENCIVGANSVVTKSMPKNCIVAGNPAKIIRMLM
jgi:acetyltransferase-like isoleucine patch superfamily enzyme